LATFHAANWHFDQFLSLTLNRSDDWWNEAIKNTIDFKKDRRQSSQNINNDIYLVLTMLSI
jgi:hypothetical protein